MALHKFSDYSSVKSGYVYTSYAGKLLVLFHLSIAITIHRADLLVVVCPSCYAQTYLSTLDMTKPIYPDLLYRAMMSNR